MNWKTLLLVVAGLSLLVSPFFLIPRHIKVASISCSSQFGPCNHNLQEELKQLEGGTLGDVKRKTREVLKNNLRISDFSVRFQIPDRLIVDVVERKSYFALRTENSDVVALVDGNGYVVSFQEPVSLPTLVIITQPPDAGEKVEAKVQFAAELLLMMHNSYQTKEGRLYEDRMTVDLLSSETVIFPLEGDSQILVGSLTAVLTRLKQPGDASRIEITDVREIDLRFKNPVLRQ